MDIVAKEMVVYGGGIKYIYIREIIHIQPLVYLLSIPIHSLVGAITAICE